MSEANRNRPLDEMANSTRERDVVWDDGVARTDAEMTDVSRDTYSTPLGGGANEDATDQDRERAGDVLGLGGADVPQTDADRALASTADPDRRRRADDLAESTPRDPIGGPDSPSGITVQD